MFLIFHRFAEERIRKKILNLLLVLVPVIGTASAWLIVSSTRRTQDPHVSLVAIGLPIDGDVAPVVFETEFLEMLYYRAELGTDRSSGNESWLKEIEEVTTVKDASKVLTRCVSFDGTVWAWTSDGYYFYFADSVTHGGFSDDFSAGYRVSRDKKVSAWTNAESAYSLKRAKELLGKKLAKEDDLAKKVETKRVFQPTTFGPAPLKESSPRGLDFVLKVLGGN